MKLWLYLGVSIFIVGLFMKNGWVMFAGFCTFCMWLEE